MATKTCPVPRFRNGKIERCGRELIGDKEKICPSCAATVMDRSKKAGMAAAGVAAFLWLTWEKLEELFGNNDKKGS